MKTKNKDNLKDLVYNYKTISEWGFMQEEIQKLIDKFPNFNIDKYNDAMMGNTCMMINYKGKDTIVNYHCDVLTGLRCGVENREQFGYEFD